MAREHRPDHRPLHPVGVLSGYQLHEIAEGPWPRQLAIAPFPDDAAAPAAIAAWGAATVLGLTEPAEMALLGVPDPAALLAASGVPWIGAPIIDYGAPDRRFDARWPDLRAVLLARLQAGEKLLIHCRGGRGRSGTIAAALLIAGGVAPAEAVRMVRAARPGAIETAEQEAWLGRQPGPASATEAV